MRCVSIIHRVRTSRENDTLGFPREVGNLLSAGEHLGVDIELTKTASDQVRVL